MNKSIIANKFLFSIIIGVLTLWIVGFLAGTPPFSKIVDYSNLGIRNILFTLDFAGKTHEKSSSLTLVAIDDKTLSDKEKWGLGRWQEFKREYYGRVIDNLKKNGALVVGIDVLFSEKADGDEILAKSIKDAGNVVLGMSYPGNGKAENILFPNDTLREHARWIGYFQPLVNPVNNFVYSVSPIVRSSDGHWHESFSLATLRASLDIAKWITTKADESSVKYDEFLQFHTGKNQFVPFSSANRNEVLVNFLPRENAFPTLSFVDVYHGNFDPSFVKDKIVFIGSNATGLHDDFLTPVGIIPGVLVHMNLVNTVLTSSYHTYVAPTAEIAILVILTFLLTIFLMHVENRMYQLFYSFIAIVIGGFFYLLVYVLVSKIFLHPTEIMLAAIMSAIAVTSYKYIYEEKGKRLLKNTLSQYLAEDLVKLVLSNYQEVKLGGVRKEVTLFFSDIAGFTTISERMSPEELVRFLSVYLKEVSDIIIHERGFVNKYEWDAVMAIWGAFGFEDRQSYLACQSALLQQEAIERMNIQFKEQFGFEISVRMGINRGPAVVGNIGSEGKKIEYTALGDTVNTASRFEWINKMYGTLICVGQSVYEKEKEHFVFRKLDSIMVKGKNLPVLMYELVGRKGSVSDDVLRKIRTFEEGFVLYQARKFEEAKAIFEDLIARYDDGPAKTFLKRTEKYISEGCEEAWEGHYRATEK